MSNTMQDYCKGIISQVLSAWTNQNKIVSAFFAKYPDETYSKEIAPGRNRASYLLGHLLAVNDRLFPLLGIGEQMFPGLDKTYLLEADNKNEPGLPIAELKRKWEAVNERLTKHFSSMSPEDWMSRHNSVSEEDFRKDPTRNKLNVVINRTNHQSYHVGQLVLLKTN